MSLNNNTNGVGAHPDDLKPETIRNALRAALEALERHNDPQDESLRLALKVAIGARIGGVTGLDSKTISPSHVDEGGSK